MRLDFFVKIKCQSSTLILSTGIKYSMSDLFMTPVTMPDLQSSDMSHTVFDVSAPSGVNST